MNSLDDVYDQMRLFQHALGDFNQEMHASARALQDSHDEVCGLWRDEAGDRYRPTYEPLAQSLKEYLEGGAPRFERFLDTKLRQLERYLHGT